jgi:hypothetical protein
MERNPQRPLNSASPMKSLNVGTLPAAPQRAALSSGEGMARTGAPKRTPTELAPAAPGMRSRILPSHDYLHGSPAAPLNDESEPPLKSYEKAIPLHPSTTPAQRATVHPIANDPGEILRDAVRLGRPQPKPAEKA